MRILIIVVLLAITQISYAQKFQDIVEYNNEFYLMTPSPSATIFFDTLSEMEFNQWMDFSASYEFRNDSLFFKEFLRLKPNNPYYEILNNNLKSGDYVNICKEFQLLRITHYKKEYENQIRFSPVFFNNENIDLIPIRVMCNYNKLFMEVDTIQIEEILWGEFILEPCNFNYLSFNSIEIKDSVNEIVVKETFYSKFNRKAYQLKEGIYSVELTSENSTLIIPKLKITPYAREKFTCKTMTYSTESSKKIDNNQEINSDEIDHTNRNYYSAKLELNYGNNTINQNALTEINNFGLGVSQQFFSSIGPRRMIDAFIDFGGNYNLSFHNTDTIQINNALILKQYYSNLNIKLATGFRFNLMRLKNEYPQRPFLELGVGYQLPIIFRHLYRGISAKFSDRWIHNFQDVYLYSRIGISNAISLQTSYRIFDVVLKNKPQLPAWQFSFIIEIPY